MTDIARSILLLRIRIEARGLEAEEVEQQVTAPLERQLFSTVPGVQAINSISQQALCVIELRFDKSPTHSDQAAVRHAADIALEGLANEGLRYDLRVEVVDGGLR